MFQEEKDKLIAFFDAENRWCQGVDAADQNGQAVHYNDEKAVCWDIVGGLCHLFGWKRALELFEPISRHMAGRRPVGTATRKTAMAAMSALCDFNDQEDMTREGVLERLRELPVWHGRRASD